MNVVPYVLQHSPPLYELTLKHKIFECIIITSELQLSCYLSNITVKYHFANIYKKCNIVFLVRLTM